MAPQVLPGGKFLYWTFTRKPENEAIFATRLGKPGKRDRLVTAQSSAVYASGYLLWRSGDSLLAQAWDVASPQPSGQPYKIVESVDRGILNELTLAVSTRGQMVYAGARGGFNTPGIPDPAIPGNHSAKKARGAQSGFPRTAVAVLWPAATRSAN